MERFGHGAEVAAQAGSFRPRDAQRHACGGDVELEQFAGRGGRTHGAVDGGGVPIAIGMNVRAQTRADFVTHYPCGENFFAGKVQLVAQCQHGWR